MLDKLTKLQSVTRKIFEIIDDESGKVRVSFYVFDSFSKLAKSDIATEWRSLDLLRTVRSFNPV